MYIGKHVCHDTESCRYLGSGKFLNASIKKHGRDNHVKEVLSVHDSEDEAYREEILQIAKHRDQHPELCMNLAIGGLGGQKGTKLSPEHRAKIGASLKGTVFTESRRRNISASLTGRVVSEETRKKTSQTLRGHVSWNTGRVRSEETKEKIRQANLGKTLSQETRDKIGRAGIGRPGTIKGKTPITDGTNNRYILATDPVPEGWRRGRTMKKRGEKN